MADRAESIGVRRRSQWPEVRAATFNDLLEIVGAGLDDFRRAPLYGLALGAIFAVGGWLLALLLFAFELPFLVYPLAIGFALIAPFVVGEDGEASPYTFLKDDEEFEQSVSEGDGALKPHVESRHQAVTDALAADVGK